ATGVRHRAAVKGSSRDREGTVVLNHLQPLSDGGDSFLRGLRAEQGNQTFAPCAWLLLEGSLIGTFVALDVVLIAVCWLSTLLTVAWLLGQGGDSERHDVTPGWLKVNGLGAWFAALGLCGLVLAFGWLRQTPNRPQPPLIFSVPELIAGLGHWTASGDNLSLWAHVSTWLFGLLVVGFTGPLWLAPFHRGFVAALVSAPPSVAIVMACVLIKVGVYGWLRFIVPVFPDLLRQHADWLTTAVGLSSLLAAVLAFGQSDWRRRVALATSSSVGLSLLGVMTLTLEGVMGGVLRVLSHGLTAALLLWLLPSSVGRAFPSDSPSADQAGQDCPTDSSAQRRRQAVFRVALFAWIGLPGLSGFVAEFVSPFGLFQHEFNVALLSLTTSGLIAWMWVRADREQPRWSAAPWLPREWIVVGTLVTLNVALGVAPQFVISRLQPSLINVLPSGEEHSANRNETDRQVHL
ncbi:MAG TPA: proton-conducting transporter membrane subunit, partial [Planctomycetaceae bacterium]|nr:proton-conducting transporter membrane subunit [Planctomycetaceae bacterium]